MTRVCLDCPAEITVQSKTGRCHRCAMRRLHADPAYQASRLKGLGAYFEKPGTRAAAGVRLQETRARLGDAEQERLREHGRWLRRVVLTPDKLAKAYSPEAIAKRTAANSVARLGWCPVDLRPAYRDLVHRKGIRAAEARRIIEAEIPGTTEHARRQIENHRFKQKLRAERERRERY